MEADAIQAMSKYLESIDLLPIWFPNVEKDNKGSEEKAEEHLRVYLLPVTPDVINVCGNKARYRWLLQVSVYVRDGVGQQRPSGYIDQLRSSLPANTEITEGIYTFKTVGVGSAAPAINKDGWYHYPVTFTIEIIK